MTGDNIPSAEGSDGHELPVPEEIDRVPSDLADPADGQATDEAISSTGARDNLDEFAPDPDHATSNEGSRTNINETLDPVGREPAAEAEADDIFDEADAAAQAARTEIERQAQPAAQTREQFNGDPDTTEGDEPAGTARTGSDVDDVDQTIAEHDGTQTAAPSQVPELDLDELEDLLEAIGQAGGSDLIDNQHQLAEGDDSWEGRRDAAHGGSTLGADGDADAETRDQDAAGESPETADGEINGEADDSGKDAEIIDLDSFRRSEEVNPGRFPGELVDAIDYYDSIDRPDLADAVLLHYDNTGQMPDILPSNDSETSDNAEHGDGGNNNGQVREVDHDATIRNIRSVEEFIEEEFDGRGYPSEVVAEADALEAQGNYDGAYGILLDYEHARLGAASPETPDSAHEAEQQPDVEPPDDTPRLF